jgi:hypothetical protein
MMPYEKPSIRQLTAADMQKLHDDGIDAGLGYAIQSLRLWANRERAADARLALIQAANELQARRDNSYGSCGLISGQDY